MKNVVLRTIACLLALFAVGCANASNLTERESNAYLSTFIDIHSWYCEKSHSDVYALRKKLMTDPRFVLSAKYEDVYETVIDGISYAITPEEDSCTTDVMLHKNGKRDTLIALKEIDLLLISRGYKKIEEKVLYEKGLNGKEVKITDIEYSTPNEERAVLSYPLEHPENFYMTLWVKKFGIKGVRAH
jgi:hypothetical protein